MADDPRMEDAINWIRRLADGNMKTITGIHLGMALTMNHPELVRALYSHIPPDLNYDAESLVGLYVRRMPWTEVDG